MMIATHQLQTYINTFEHLKEASYFSPINTFIPNSPSTTSSINDSLLSKQLLKETSNAVLKQSRSRVQLKSFKAFLETCSHHTAKKIVIPNYPYPGNCEIVPLNPTPLKKTIQSEPSRKDMDYSIDDYLPKKPNLSNKLSINHKKRFSESNSLNKVLVSLESFSQKLRVLQTSTKETTGVNSITNDNKGLIKDNEINKVAKHCAEQIMKDSRNMLNIDRVGEVSNFTVENKPLMAKKYKYEVSPIKDIAEQDSPKIESDTSRLIESLKSKDHMLIIPHLVSDNLEGTAPIRGNTTMIQNEINLSEAINRVKRFATIKN